MVRNFWRNLSGSIGPIFIVCLPVLVSAVGFSVDYSRMLSHKGKLQSATDLAVDIAMQEAKGGDARARLAQQFLEANMPGANVESRRAMVDGKIQFQVRSKLETPMLAMVGKPYYVVKISVPMPNGIKGRDGKIKGYTYSKKQLRELRKRLDQLIRNAPPKLRGRYKREYDAYYDRLSRNSRSQ